MCSLLVPRNSEMSPRSLKLCHSVTTCCLVCWVKFQPLKVTGSQWWETETGVTCDLRLVSVKSPKWLGGSFSTVVDFTY